MLTFQEFMHHRSDNDSDTFLQFTYFKTECENSLTNLLLQMRCFHLVDISVALNHQIIVQFNKCNSLHLIGCMASKTSYVYSIKYQTQLFNALFNV